jgi:hypothetical protein
MQLVISCNSLEIYVKSQEVESKEGPFQNVNKFSEFSGNFKVLFGVFFEIFNRVVYFKNFRNKNIYQSEA